MIRTERIGSLNTATCCQATGLDALISLYKYISIKEFVRFAEMMDLDERWQHGPPLI